MKQNAIRLLLALNLALAAALAWLWVDAQGQWRNTRWQPPLPVQPDVRKAPFFFPEPFLGVSVRLARLGDWPVFHVIWPCVPWPRIHI